MGAGDYPAASRSFKQAVSGFSGYALQLEIICKPSSAKQGWAQARGGSEYLLLPFSFRGRPCYRVLWGVYSSKSDARRAVSSVPNFFTAQFGGKPVPVVRLRGR